MSILGTRVIRTEDPRLLTSGGVYVDDLRTPELHGAARVTFVRSPVAHGRITGIDVTEASQQPGVIAVLTAGDMDDLAPPPPDGGDGVSEGPMPLGGPWSEPLLATDTVRFVGEPVAVVITDDRYQGEDAADLVGVDYEALPAVVGPAAALTGESLLFPAAGSNIPFANPVPDDDAPFDVCDVVVEQDIVNQRVACLPMEGRATAAAFSGGKLTVWHSSQNAQLCRLILCGALGMSPDQIRVVVPDVGGGFGAKVGIDRDAIIVAWAARKTGRALRWAETRSENLVGMTQGRAQLHHIKIGGTHDGKILAYRIDVIQDSGAYGRMGQFPFQTKTGALYDTGQYAEALDKVLTGAHYEELRQEQERRRARGDVRQLGIGVSTYVEITAADGAAGETAKLEVSDDGTATVYTGSSPHGQGHHTAWAMLVQEELGIPMDQVTVIHGDTDLIPVGVGTYASRSLQLGGSAVYKAAAEVKDEARHQAADMLEAAQADVVLDTMTGLWQVRGDPDTALSWAQVAGHTSGGSLIADVSFTADVPTFPFGAHVSVVEVDTETGQVTLLRHVTVDDAGPVLNPVLAEGQRHGGIAQGAAQALLEEVLYDADGNPLTSTLADYAAITAAELPSYELVNSETPTTLNPLGVKGIGEAGTIGSTPAIQNAVIDAVAHLGIRHIDMPATPQRVWAAINEAHQALQAQKAGNQ